MVASVGPVSGTPDTGHPGGDDRSSLGPRSIERPADAGWTLVAALDGAGPVVVDGGGALSPVDDGGLLRPWAIDWWVGADDRWHLPAREASVRQRRLGPGPVIETSLRVPSGDVVHTAHPVVEGGRPLTVLEIRNQSPVPVALAVAIRPLDVDGAGPPDGRDGPAGPPAPGLALTPEAVVIDGRVRLWLPRRPSEAGASAAGDLLDRVLGGRPLTWDGEVRGRGANAVCLYPLPHGTSLRFAVEPAPPHGSGPAGVGPPPLGRLADAEASARGWSAVVDRAGRVELPDDGVGALAGAARARLLLAGPGLGRRLVDGRAGAGLTLAGLAIGGHRFECRRALAAVAQWFPTELAGGPAEAALVVQGIGLAAELLAGVPPPGTGADTAAADAELVARLLDVGAQLTHLVDRAPADRGRAGAVAAAPGAVLGPAADPASMARAGLARLARAAGQPEAATALAAAPPAGGPIGRLGRRLPAVLGGRSRPGSTGPAPGHRPATAAPEVDRPDGRTATTATTTHRDQLGDLMAAAERAAPARRWGRDRADEAAAFWIAARRMLLDEVAPAGPGAPALVELLPAFPPAWLGGPVEVHRAPVAGVAVSFAIRWHGYRPALLWEVDGAGPGGLPPVLSCPALDPDWRSDAPSGEVLLAGVADRLPPAPSAGDSFR